MPQGTGLSFTNCFIMFPTPIYPEITKSILGIVKAEKIFVLAITQMEKQTDSIFFKPALLRSSSTHLYLLVLISKEESCNYTAIQSQIESVCPATVIAMEMEMFNEWLGEGHPFAVQTKINASLVYDNNTILLSEHPIINENDLLKQRFYLYQSGIEKMKELMAANQLHAASACGLQTILKANIGLEFQPNNIDQLMSYCSIVIKEIPKIFPNKNYDNNPPVEQIYALLQSLYAPYKTLT